MFVRAPKIYCRDGESVVSRTPAQGRPVVERTSSEGQAVIFDAVIQVSARIARRICS
jgi:hypothetical protein